MSSAPTSALRRLFEDRIAQLSSEVEGFFAEASERGRREFADQLNQAVRRIRQSATLEELATTLADTAAEFSTGAALFRIDYDTAKGERIRGVTEATLERFRELEIPLASAAAFQTAIETRDQVTAVTSSSEISEPIAALLAPAPESRASVYPLVSGERVPALLYAWGTVEGSVIELLTQVAAGVWDELAKPPEPPPPPPLVQIAPPPESPSAPREPASAWEGLSPDEQQLHLRAQRFARVQAAGMRLHEPELVHSGRAHRDLYNTLRKPIDTARESFHKSFFVPCPSMVDYLHLELVRTLANDDAELLGPDYPGPML